MYQDVKKIIESTPDWVCTKKSEACLFLFALYTGARAISCSNIKVGDVERVYWLKKSRIVQIKIRVSKNIDNDD